MKLPAGLAFFLLLAACGRGEMRDGASDIAGVMPDLSFAMMRADDGKKVSATDYRGKAVLLYFGYTHCPDECPTTLANLAAVLRKLGPAAKKVRVLFVTVDPQRDTRPILKAYVNSFAPEVDGLRGTEDEIAGLARRYRVLYRVTPPVEGNDTAVMHSDSTFFFDENGHARLVTTRTDDVNALRADLIRIM